MILTVNDRHGHTDTDSVDISPTAAPNTAPTAAITGVSCTNLSCSFDGRTSSDPESDTLLYSWNFDDGSDASTSPNPTHVYGAAGARTVVLTVDDQHGHTDTESVDISPTAAPNAAPTVDITGVTCDDLNCAFTSTATDPDNDTLTYSWDFGDRTSDRRRTRRTPTRPPVRRR